MSIYQSKVISIYRTLRIRLILLKIVISIYQALWFQFTDHCELCLLRIVISIYQSKVISIYRTVRITFTEDCDFNLSKIQNTFWFQCPQILLQFQFTKHCDLWMHLPVLNTVDLSKIMIPQFTISIYRYTRRLNEHTTLV